MGWNVALPTAEYYDLGDEKLDGLIREIKDQKAAAIDTETDGLTLHKCIPYYWSLSWTSSNGRDRRVTMGANTLQAFRECFADYEKSWVFANAKFDCHMLANFGIDIKGNLVDTQVMHALLYEAQPHSLKDMARQILGWKWTDFQDTFGKVRSNYCICGGTKASHNNAAGFCKKTNCFSFRQITPLDVLQKMARENPELLVDYAANDAYGTWKLYQTLDDALGKEDTWSLYSTRWPYIKTMRDYFYQTEVPFTRVLFACERNGLKVNKQYLVDLQPKLQKMLDDIKIEINTIVGKRFNSNSGPQLVEYFIDECGLRPFKMTKGGKSGIKKPSIDEKFLEWHADNTEGEIGKVAGLVLEFKKIDRQKGTYIEKMPGRLDKNDRVHARANQDIARTGRLSSSDPNMQNVTGGEKDRFHLRRAFIPEAGNDMIVADYSQLEMRLLAAASQESKMMDIFHRGWDIHMGNAAMMFEIPYDDLVSAKKIDKMVKKGELPESAITEYIQHCLTSRDHVKAIGFGLNYGMKERALARRMGCSVEEAIAKIDQYMNTYPAVRQFFDETVEDTRRTGYAFTLLGRRRYLPDILSSDDFTRFRAERQSSNMPIQGTAAEVCKMAMINIHEDVELRNKYGYLMCLQVHDEIVGESPKETTEIVKERIREWMEHPFPTDIGVPLTAEIGSGESWGHAK